ncbi:hypothetical protein BY996DRAFT_7528514 [Phakopsora pachyrhizi]|nr:hypothetical protein BY996DRAFT_7528514 [Phakopsora pachyrhizi]
MSQSGAPPKDSEISTPSPRSEIINTQKNKLDLSNPDVVLMKTLLSKEDETDINTSTGVIKKTLLSSPIESMIITKERKSEHQKHPIAGKESVLPKDMSAGQKHSTEKMTIGFEKGNSENKTRQSSFPINTQSSSLKPNPFLGQNFSFGKFILPAKELPHPQRVYKNPKAKHSNIKYNEKIQSNLVPTVQKKRLRLSAPRELVTERYQEEDDEEATRIKSGGSKPVRGKIFHDTDSDEDFYSEAVGSSPLKDKVERNNKGKGRAESLDLSIYSLGNEKGAISRPGSRVRYSFIWEVEMTDSSLSASDKEFANRAPRPNTSFSLWPLILGESSKKLDHSGVQKQTQVSITPKKSNGKLNNPSSRPHGPSENSSAKKPILKNPALSSSTSMVIDEDRPKLQSSSEAEQHESGAEHSSQSYYELETRMRQRKGLRKKTTDKSKRLSKNQRLKKINGELPNNVGGMRTVVQVHCRFLLGIQDRDLATILPPPSAEEREIAIAQAGHAGFVPDGFDTGPSVSRQTKAYKSFVKSKLLKLGLHWFSWDWDSSWTHPFNELMSIIFYKTLDLALLSCEYNNYTCVSLAMKLLVLCLPDLFKK